MKRSKLEKIKIKTERNRRKLNKRNKQRDARQPDRDGKACKSAIRRKGRTR